MSTETDPGHLDRTDDVMRVRWRWIVATVVAVTVLVVAGMLTTYQPIAHGQWSSVDGAGGEVVVASSDIARAGEDVEVAVDGVILDGRVDSVTSAGEGGQPLVVVSLPDPIDAEAGDPVSLRFPAVPILVGLVSR